jgi:hypothetical protein
LFSVSTSSERRAEPGIVITKAMMTERLMIPLVMGCVDFPQIAVLATKARGFCK